MFELNQHHYLQNMPAGCLVFNLDACISYVNHTLCQMLDYTAEQLISSSVEKILSLPSRIFYQTHFFPLLRIQGEVAEIFLSLKKADGATIPVMVNAKAQISDDVTTYLCILVVVAERQKYEQQLLAAQKAQQKLLEENQVLNELRSQLEAHQFELDQKVRMYQQLTEDFVQMGKALMHDMQEPIRKMIFYTSTLIRQGDQNAPNTRMLDVIEKSAHRLRKLFGSLLDFIQINFLEEQTSLLSLGDLVAHAQIQVSLELAFDDYEVTISGDIAFEGRRNALQKVFTELIRNAVKHRDPYRRLHILIDAIILKENAYQVSPDKYRYIDHVQIRIADNGQGFDRRFCAYIFGLLNKLDTTTDGAGVGLAMCRQLISFHFGSIKADSRPGHGSTFTIQLPLSLSK